MIKASAPGARGLGFNSHPRPGQIAKSAAAGQAPKNCLGTVLGLVARCPYHCLWLLRSDGAGPPCLSGVFLRLTGPSLKSLSRWGLTHPPPPPSPSLPTFFLAPLNNVVVMGVLKLFFFNHHRSFLICNMYQFPHFNISPKTCKH